MVIQNTPEAGIKLGRGHECEIRITDISVSRKHAYIKIQNNEFFILDNNSKFGTLVRDENM
jgi:pSer/pThr/pTyr-binding forkhead associated (FHA) protein